MDGKSLVLIENDASRLLVGANIHGRATAKKSLCTMKKAMEAYGMPGQFMTDYVTHFTSTARDDCPEPGPSDLQQWLEDTGTGHVRAKVKHSQSSG